MGVTSLALAAGLALAAMGQPARAASPEWLIPDMHPGYSVEGPKRHVVSEAPGQVRATDAIGARVSGVSSEELVDRPAIADFGADLRGRAVVSTEGREVDDAMIELGGGGLAALSIEPRGIVSAGPELKAVPRRVVGGGEGGQAIVAALSEADLDRDPLVAAKAPLPAEPRAYVHRGGGSEAIDRPLGRE